MAKKTTVHSGPSALRQYNVRLPEDLRNTFHAQCRDAGLIPAEQLRKLVSDFVAQRGGIRPGA